MQRLVPKTKALGPLLQAPAPVHTSAGDPNFAGVKWHVDLNGNEFPFSRGCSFYEVGLFGVACSSCSVGLPAHTTGQVQNGHCRKLPAAFASNVGCWCCCALLELAFAYLATCCMVQLKCTLPVPADFAPSLLLCEHTTTISELFLCAGE